MDQEKYIIIGGDPVDGFGHRGPFNNAEEAREYAEREYTETTWWIAPLYPIPTENEDNEQDNLCIRE